MVGSSTRAATRRPLAFWTPIVLLVGVVVAFSVSMWTYADEAPDSGLLPRILGSLTNFRGSYLKLPGQSDSPSTRMALIEIVSPLVAFATVSVAAVALTKRFRDYFRARGAGTDLIVIGSDREAARVLRYRDHPPGKQVLLITGDPAGEAVVAAENSVAHIVRDLPRLPTDSDLVARCRSAHHVAIATGDDALNLKLARQLADPHGTHSPDNRVIALISHSPLVDELRPAVIEASLPNMHGVTSPDESIAEQVGHHIDNLLLTDAAFRGAGTVALAIESDDSILARTVIKYLGRFARSRAFLAGNDVDVPEIIVSPGGAPDTTRTVRVVVHADPAATASETLRLLRSPTDDRTAVATIAVTDSELLGSRYDSPRLKIIDPIASAWNHSAIFDDMQDQWGRSYHYSYEATSGSAASMMPYETIAERRAGQSSVGAVTSMLAILSDHGFHLVKTDNEPLAPPFTAQEIDSMAEAEHVAWRDRTYTEDGIAKRVAAGRPTDVEWAGLDTTVQRNNRRTVRRAYPALAALYGYQIERGKPAPAGR